MNNYPTNMLFDNMLSWINVAMEKDLDDYSTNFPPTDIYAGEDDELIFDFAVAGYDPNEINISFSGESMSVYTKNAEMKTEEKTFFKKRIAKRSFDLKYSLKAGRFDTEKAVATHKNGILRITIPRSEFSKPREVKIEIN